MESNRLHVGNGARGVKIIVEHNDPRKYEDSDFSDAEIVANALKPLKVKHRLDKEGMVAAKGTLASEEGLLRLRLGSFDLNIELLDVARVIASAYPDELMLGKIDDEKVRTVRKLTASAFR